MADTGEYNEYYNMGYVSARPAEEQGRELEDNYHLYVNQFSPGRSCNPPVQRGYTEDEPLPEGMYDQAGHGYNAPLPANPRHTDSSGNSHVYVSMHHRGSDQKPPAGRPRDHVYGNSGDVAAGRSISVSPDFVCLDLDSDVPPCDQQTAETGEAGDDDRSQASLTPEDLPRVDDEIYLPTNRAETRVCCPWCSRRVMLVVMIVAIVTGMLGAGGLGWYLGSSSCPEKEFMTTAQPTTNDITPVLTSDPVIYTTTPGTVTTEPQITTTEQTHTQPPTTAGHETTVYLTTEGDVNTTITDETNTTASFTHSFSFT